MEIFCCMPASFSLSSVSCRSYCSFCDFCSSVSWSSGIWSNADNSEFTASIPCWIFVNVCWSAWIICWSAASPSLPVWIFASASGFAASYCASPASYCASPSWSCASPALYWFCACSSSLSFLLNVFLALAICFLPLVICAFPLVNCSSASAILAAASASSEAASALPCSSSSLASSIFSCASFTSSCFRISARSSVISSIWSRTFSTFLSYPSVNATSFFAPLTCTYTSVYTSISNVSSGTMTNALIVPVPIVALPRP